MTRRALIALSGVLVAAFSGLPPILGLAIGMVAAWFAFLFQEGCKLAREDIANDLKDEWEGY